MSDFPNIDDSALRKSDIAKLKGKFNIRSGFTRISKILEADSRVYFYIFIIAVFVIFGLLFEQSYQQYQVWSQNEISKFLLPPYQTLNYFAFYVFTRFFAPYLISLIAAFLFFFAAKTLNKKYEERFFEPEEFWLGALAIFLTGHPGWLFYLVFIILLYLLIHIFYICYGYCRSGYTRIITRKNADNHNGSEADVNNSVKRISLYWLWIPAGIFVILIQRWLEILPLWSLLKI